MAETVKELKNKIRAQEVYADAMNSFIQSIKDSDKLTKEDEAALKTYRKHLSYATGSINTDKLKLQKIKKSGKATGLKKAIAATLGAGILISAIGGAGYYFGKRANSASSGTSVVQQIPVENDTINYSIAEFQEYVNQMEEGKTKQFFQSMIDNTPNTILSKQTPDDVLADGAVNMDGTDYLVPNKGAGFTIEQQQVMTALGLLSYSNDGNRSLLWNESDTEAMYQIFKGANVDHFNSETYAGVKKQIVLNIGAGGNESYMYKWFENLDDNTAEVVKKYEDMKNAIADAAKAEDVPLYNKLCLEMADEFVKDNGLDFNDTTSGVLLKNIHPVAADLINGAIFPGINVLTAGKVMALVAHNPQNNRNIMVDDVVLQIDSVAGGACEIYLDGVFNNVRGIINNDISNAQIRADLDALKEANGLPVNRQINGIEKNIDGKTVIYQIEGGMSAIEASYQHSIYKTTNMELRVIDGKTYSVPYAPDGNLKVNVTDFAVNNTSIIPLSLAGKDQLELFNRFGGSGPDIDLGANPNTPLPGEPITVNAKDAETAEKEKERTAGANLGSSTVNVTIPKIAGDIISAHSADLTVGHLQSAFQAACDSAINGKSAEFKDGFWQMVGSVDALANQYYTQFINSRNTVLPDRPIDPSNPGVVPPEVPVETPIETPVTPPEEAPIETPVNPPIDNPVTPPPYDPFDPNPVEGVPVNTESDSVVEQAPVVAESTPIVSEAPVVEAQTVVAPMVAVQEETVDLSRELQGLRDLLESTKNVEQQPIEEENIEMGGMQR